MASAPFRFENPVRVLLLVLILVGVVAGLRSASHRWQVEMDNRRVEVAVDFSELRNLAASSGQPLSGILMQFRAAGATSVVLQEDTIGGLVEEKRLQFAPMYTDFFVATGLYSPDPTKNGLFQMLPELPRVQTYITRKTHFEPQFHKTDGVLEVDAPWQNIRGIGVGLDGYEAALIGEAGLQIVGRVGNWNGVSPASLAWTLADLKKHGVSTVIFSGDEVLGYKGYIAPKKGDPAAEISTVDVLRQQNMFYGSVEFGKQKGDAELSKAAPDRVVRVHTITGGEMLSATVPEATQRFALAARERNMRVLFVRLFLDEPEAVVFNTDYVQKIVRSLERGNLTTGRAHGYEPLGVGFLTRLLIGLAIGAAFLLLADSVTRFLSGGLAPVLGALFWVLAIGLVALAASPVVFGVKLAALAAALIFPALGLLAHDLLGNELWYGAWGRFLFTCVVTCFGIACVVGLLAGQSFLVKADAFIGIKATLAVPLLLVAVVYALDLRARDGRGFSEAVRQTTHRLVALSRQPVLFWQVVAGAFALVLVFVILSRSGNEGVGVSGLELKIRSLFDRFLPARPRFKDLFGHAAMVFALLLYDRTRRREWALPLFLLGVFGQESLLNTFCHLHTPLAVSLWRAALGVAGGGIIGMVVFFVVDRALLRRLGIGSAKVKRAR